MCFLWVLTFRLLNSVLNLNQCTKPTNQPICDSQSNPPTFDNVELTEWTSWRERNGITCNIVLYLQYFSAFAAFVGWFPFLWSFIIFCGPFRFIVCVLFYAFTLWSELRRVTAPLICACVSGSTSSFILNSFVPFLFVSFRSVRVECKQHFLHIAICMRVYRTWIWLEFIYKFAFLLPMFFCFYFTAIFLPLTRWTNAYHVQSS